MDKTTGLTHLIKSTQYSMQGLKSAVKYETAFRHELFCCLFIYLFSFMPCIQTKFSSSRLGKMG